MADYLELPLTADATALGDLGKDYLTEQIPGWTARPGNVESIMLESAGQMGAEVVDQAAQVPPVVFAFYGDWLLGITLRDATPATSTVAITFAEDALVTVPEGTLLAAPNPDGESYVFQTDNDVRSDGPNLTTVTALEAGAAANGSSGVAELIDTVDGVEIVTMTVVASGGADEESGDDYLARLADALTILAPRPILPGDFATFALQVPSVGRALAIDLYQPSNAEGGFGAPRDAQSHTDVPRCVTVAVTADDGSPPSNALMQLVFNTLEAAREVNFLNYVIPPSYTTIDVQATVVPFPGFTLGEVEEAAEEMLRTWLDPLVWGSSTVGETQEWARNTSVRIFEAVDFLNRADGVHYVETVQIRESGGEWVTEDIPLDGAAPLPLAGQLDVTAVTGSSS